MLFHIFNTRQPALWSLRLCRLLIGSLLILPARSPATTDCATTIAMPHKAGGALANRDGYMGIQLKGSLRLTHADCEGIKLTGLSALTWSGDTGVLYALSDRGQLFHLRPVFSDDQLTEIDIITAHTLRDARDQPLSIEQGDSEGLTVINGNNGKPGDEMLLIAFERQPRIARFSPKGSWKANLPLPAELTVIEHYDHFNRSLESVTRHPVHGLLTAPERPLKQHDDGHFRIYDSQGELARFTPANYEYGSITDMALSPDGDLLVLERIFSGVFGIVAAVIHRLEIDRTEKGETLNSQIIVRMDRDDGHFIDNFEGLTHHRDNHYFIVSDDNSHPLQQTLLMYFEVTE